MKGFVRDTDTPNAFSQSTVWTVLSLQVDDGEFVLGSFPVSFEKGDLYLVSFKRTKNVAFVETTVSICAKMRIHSYF